MNMKKKLVTVCLVACMAVTAVAGGTLAYFTDKEEATNTFTVGNVDIKLEEEGWVEDSKLVPAAKIAKEPIITVEDGSEEAWIFAEIELDKNFADVIVKCGGENATVKSEMPKWFNIDSTQWNYVTTEDREGGSVAVVYAYKEKVAENASATLFTEVTVAQSFGDEELGTKLPEGTKPTVKIYAKAIQTEGLNTSEAAYQALYNNIDITDAE